MKTDDRNKRTTAFKISAAYSLLPTATNFTTMAYALEKLSYTPDV